MKKLDHKIESSYFSLVDFNQYYGVLKLWGQKNISGNSQHGISREY